MLPIRLQAGVTVGRYQLVRLLGEGAERLRLRGERRDPVPASGAEGTQDAPHRGRPGRTGAGTVFAGRANCFAHSSRPRRRRARLWRSRGCSIPRHGVRRRREPRAAARARDSAPTRADRRHSAAGSLCGRGAARPSGRAPRHQAGQYSASAWRRNPPKAGRLRRVAFARGGRGDHAIGGDRGDSRVHGGGAHARRTGRDGEERSVRDRCGPLRMRDGPQAVPWVDGLRSDVCGGQRGALAAVRITSRRCRALSTTSCFAP